MNCRFAIPMMLTELILIASASASVPAWAGPLPLPRLPRMVWELYLPEEYEACAVIYKIYASLPAEEMGKLHRGKPVSLQAEKLPERDAQRLAAWFNCARWGCDPPAEKLDAEAVAKSTLLLTHDDGVVELALQSPQKGIWKKLAIACAPEKAEGVRDGLPLLPYWALVPWDGGQYPPVPEREDLFVMPRWQMLRAVYAVYCNLSPGQRRQLHTAHQLGVEFASLPAERQRAIAEAVDYSRLCTNKAFHAPLEMGRPPDARSRHFGITRMSFVYGRSIPDAEMAAVALGMNLEGVDPCPRPFRSVVVTLDTHYPPVPQSRPAPWAREISMVACPPELQRSLLIWRRRYEDWQTRWRTPDGLSLKPGAPPYPRHPAE